MKAVTGNETGQSSPSQDRPSLVLTRCPEWLSLNLSLCSGRKGNVQTIPRGQGCLSAPLPHHPGGPLLTPAASRTALLRDLGWTRNQTSCLQPGGRKAEA